MRYFLFIALFTFVSCGEDVATPKSFWVIQSQTDDFGDIVPGKEFELATIQGLENGQPCDVQLVRMEGFIGFGFSALGSAIMKPLPHRSFITVKIKEDNSEPINTELYIYDDLVSDYDGVLDSLINASSRSIKIAVNLATVSTTQKDKYTFEIDKDSFLSEPISTTEP